MVGPGGGERQQGRLGEVQLGLRGIAVTVIEREHSININMRNVGTIISFINTQHALRPIF